MALGSTQPLTEMNTRSISWGKGGRCVMLTTYHHPVPLSRNPETLTSWSLLGHSRPVTELTYLLQNCPDGLCVPLILLFKGIRSSFLGVKQPGCEFDHSPFSVEVKNGWSYTSISPLYIHKCVQGRFYLLLFRL